MKGQEHAYEKITDVVEEIDAGAKEVRLLLGVVDYDAPYLLHHDVSLHMPSYGDAKNKAYDFLSRIDMLKTVTLLEQKN